MGKGKTFIIGDIHGCLETLKRLMEKIDWLPEEDMLIFLGDYIDRGQNSKGVVDYILGLRKASSGVQCLLGNHEAIFLEYLSGRDRRLFIINGGVSTLESYQRERNEEDESSLVSQSHIEFYESLRTLIELEDFYVVHAGFRPGVKLEKQSLEDMLWIRDPFIYSQNHFQKRVIFGHTPFYEPLVMDNKIGLDTGAVYGNKLTCLELPDLRFHSVEA
jgi:serine/threonine protein phosphatase 1